jgi:hypothetical protein
VRVSAGISCGRAIVVAAITLVGSSTVPLMTAAETRAPENAGSHQIFLKGQGLVQCRGAIVDAADFAFHGSTYV